MTFEHVAEQRAALDHAPAAQPVARRPAGPRRPPPGAADGPESGRLPVDLRAGIEALSAIDLSAVRVHTGSQQPATFGADAYAQGHDIHVAPGQERHLPHEAWHVVQQLQGRVRPIAQFNRATLNDDPALEREADVMGARAATIGRRIVAAAAPFDTADRSPSPRRPAATASRAMPIQRSPTKRYPNMADSPWYESKHPNVELIMLDKEKFRIKGTEQIVYWKPSKYYVKQAGPQPMVEFDMAKHAENPEFLDFTTMFKEVSATTTADVGLKRALQMHVLQRFIANAVYSSGEISKMHYQASPLNFAAAGSYLRSHATSFVAALKTFIGAASPDVHLVRSTDFNDVLAQFLDRFDGTDLAADLSAKITQVAQFAIDRKGLEGFSDAYGMLFADVSKDLLGLDNLPAMKTIVKDAATRINAKVFNDTRDAVVRKYVETAYADSDVLQRDTIVKELLTVVDGTGGDLPTFLAYLNPKKRLEFENKRAGDAAAVRVAKNATIGGDGTLLFDQFKQELGPYREWLKKKGAAALNPDELAYTTAKADSRDRFKALIPTDSFRNYLESKAVGIEATRYTDVKAPSLKAGEVKPLVDLVEKLKTGLPDITMVGGSILLQGQAGFLLKEKTGDELVKSVEFALNKAGYVPTPSASSRKMLDLGKSLQEIVVEVATQQKDHYAKKAEAAEKIQKFIDEISTFDPKTYRSRLEAVDQLNQTIISFRKFDALVGDYRSYVKLQAASLVKVINGLKLLEPGSKLPDIALQELRVNFDDAMRNKDDIAAFIRNIQNIHEVVIMAIERDPAAAAGLVAKDLAIPSGARSPHVTDYGLKAFAQAYNGAVAQMKGADMAIDAYASIYFELSHKLSTAKVNAEGAITVRTPHDLAEYKALESGVKVVVKRPDLVLIDIHPNDASKTKLSQQQVTELIKAMFDGTTPDYRVTVVVDITLNHVSDPAVKEIKDATQKFINNGQLNLVFIQSLTKFAEMGSDKQSGGLMFHYNDDVHWTEFNTSITEAIDVGKPDPTAENYFRAMFKYAEVEQKAYIVAIRDNTKYVYDQLSAEFARLHADPKTIELSISDDPGKCYVAFNYEELAARLFAGEQGRDVKTEALGKRILNDAIYHLVNKLNLPLSMRQSFAFPISNVGEAWVGSRFTIGTETHGMLDEYIRVITYVKASLANIPDDVMKDDSKRRDRFKALSADIANLNDLKRKLDALMIGR